MNATVVEVGPVTVRGPGPVSAERAAVAVAGIDDEIVLVDDEPVGVAGLLAEVLDAAATGAPTLTLVCPTWWTAAQRERVRAAGSASGAEVVVLQRVRALSRALASASWVVVEISDVVIMVSGADVEPVLLGRHLDVDVDPESVVRAVIAIAGVSSEVVVDAPPEVTGAVVLGRAVVAELRRRGVMATLTGAQNWRAGLSAPEVPADQHVAMRVWPRRVAMCVAAIVAAVLGGIAIVDQRLPSDHPAMTVLVEGRVGMQIPAAWTVRRVTEGPGSARVQVISSSEPQVMIHLTQSAVGEGAVAEAVRRAIHEQPGGVFVDFDPVAVIGVRQVVSYREVRAGREIRWAVFVDGPVRIAVGCQSAPGRWDAIREACETATGSAHAVF